MFFPASFRYNSSLSFSSSHVAFLASLSCIYKEHVRPPYSSFPVFHFFTLLHSCSLFCSAFHPNYKVFYKVFFLQQFSTHFSIYLVYTLFEIYPNEKFSFSNYKTFLSHLCNYNSVQILTQYFLVILAFSFYQLLHF